MKRPDMHEVAISEKAFDNPRSFYHGCNRKKPHPSKKIAQGILRAMTNRGYDTRNMGVYKCSFCGAWHLGHNR